MGYTLSRETVIRVSVIDNGISFREKMDVMIERTAEERWNKEKRAPHTCPSTAKTFVQGVKPASLSQEFHKFTSLPSLLNNQNDI